MHGFRVSVHNLPQIVHGSDRFIVQGYTFHFFKMSPSTKIMKNVLGTKMFIHVFLAVSTYIIPIAKGFRP